MQRFMLAIGLLACFTQDDDEPRNEQDVARIPPVDERAFAYRRAGGSG